jgi:AraC family transcriptional regulator of adaptative response/methylated-DNA-[protein]-cysteine methyltransferase
MVTTEAVTPGQYKNAGEGLTVRHGIAPSPFGRAFVSSTERGISSMSFVDHGGDREALRAAKKELPRATFVPDVDVAAEVVALAFRTDVREPAPLSLWLRGTPFQLKVWEAVLALPPGEAASYGAVADAVGVEGAARAVGSALGANRIAVLVPCHRVIRSVGETSAYRWGRERKRLLLAWESARAET